ncbi:MAG: hypothetical protein A3J63_01735 [Candidatus Moranbacteria bacterium RIFCSPHIGHO2_02_FULL_40_12b]|nr:MAG: hypothetical protein A3J63_01735 [Candidatus Moranbacteria bacterium RIFCSPHIGHO2_02_FULL_40_12b]OGI24098.1 MAG: hypothetical protein A3E91_01220 [Candidatus Moranbacteria bacterium RIFCSPHIGHO2_12_FULL_40_10]
MTQENPKEFFSTNPPLPSGEGGGEGVKKKKILLVTRPICPPWDEASKNFAYNLAKNIRDCEITLLTCGKISRLSENIKQEPIYSSVRFNFFQKLRLVIFLFFNARKYDVIHLLFTPTKTNGWIIKYILKSPLIPLWKRGRIKVKIIQTIATLREDLYGDAEIKKMLFGDRIITYSQHAKNKLNSLGFNNVTQVYPGIDLEHYSPTPKSNLQPTTYNLQPDDFVVTYPGEYARLGAANDIMDMILRYSSILKNNNIKLVFACRVKNEMDARKKEEVKRKLEAAGCLDNVIFTDTVSDMAELYNISDVVIFPVRDMKGKFDVPLAVTEAMACGKPVILSDLAILKEFANENNSVIIKNGDIEQLKSSILDLYQNKNKREEVGKNGRKYIEANFDIKIVAERYKEIYLS